MTRLSIATLAMTSGAAAAFVPLQPAARIQHTSATTSLDASSLAVEDRPIYDPLGLYDKQSVERTSNRIQPLEEEPTTDSVARPVIDPLNLYGNRAEVNSAAEMSSALPFTPRPSYLDGTLAGDAGFDPLGLATNPDRLKFMRESELKHGRIAMLATVGWAMAESFHTKFAAMTGLRPLLQYGDRVPSVLNGGLAHAIGDCWPYMAAILAFAGGVEIVRAYNKNLADDAMVDITPGDFGFDPFGFYRDSTDEKKLKLEEAELKHSRLAMLAITFFALQEAFTGAGVMPQLVSLLNPHSVEFLADQGFSSNLEAILSGTV